MTQEEKIREILDRHFGHHVTEGSDEWYTRNYQNRFLDLQVMAEWKEQQMLDKAVNYIYNHAHVTTFGDIRLEKCSVTQFIEDFKKAMEG